MNYSYTFHFVTMLRVETESLQQKTFTADWELQNSFRQNPIFVIERKDWIRSSIENLFSSIQTHSNQCFEKKECFSIKILFYRKSTKRINLLCGYKARKMRLQTRNKQIASMVRIANKSTVYQTKNRHTQNIKNTVFWAVRA